MQIDWIPGGLSYVVFLFSTTCHEAAHAWSAYRLGDDTAYRGGQVTLNPAPHVLREPMGMLAVPLISFLFGGWMIGWASCPFSPQWALSYPRRSALMAMAGPVANMVLVVAALLLMKSGLAAGVFIEPPEFTWRGVVEAPHGNLWSVVAQMLSLLFSMNLLLCVFNLLPFPPLDGASLPLLFLPGKMARSYLAMKASVGFLGIVLAWKIFDGLFPPVWRFMVVFFFD